MEQSQIKIFYPTNIAEWRNWLQENHLTHQAVWVVFHTKSSVKPTITWSEAVDVALCFGWIDSKKISIDKETSHQYFSKRKTQSTWSKVNKQKIELLTQQGLMADAGFKTIETAKQNGSWTILDSVEELILPNDLKEALTLKPLAMEFYEGLSKSAKKGILLWLVLAKKPETRQKRIDEIAELASQNKKPKHL